jgi:hypothetical protein
LRSLLCSCRYDFIWLDGISSDDRFLDLVRVYWKERLNKGGYLAVHSTLTNTLSKGWMRQIEKEREAEKGRVEVDFEIAV